MTEKFEAVGKTRWDPVGWATPTRPRSVAKQAAGDFKRLLDENVVNQQADVLAHKLDIPYELAEWIQATLKRALSAGRAGACAVSTLEEAARRFEQRMA